jgi:hypothetical protein
MPAKIEYSTALWYVTLPVARKLYKLQITSNLFCTHVFPLVSLTQQKRLKYEPTVWWNQFQQQPKRSFFRLVKLLISTIRFILRQWLRNWFSGVVFTSLQSLLVIDLYHNDISSCLIVCSTFILCHYRSYENSDEKYFCHFLFFSLIFSLKASIHIHMEGLCIAVIQCTLVGERGDSWHTFHFIIFHIFSVLVKLNVTARKASNTLGLQSDLHKFDAIHKE